MLKGSSCFGCITVGRYVILVRVESREHLANHAKTERVGFGLSSAMC